MKLRKFWTGAPLSAKDDDNFLFGIEGQKFHFSMEVLSKSFLFGAF